MMSVSKKKSKSESFLFVNNGSILQSSLECSGKTEEWLKSNLSRQSYSDIDELFCVEWTPGRGFYVTQKNENKSITEKEINDISN